MPTEYLLYIDDSGTRSYASGNQQYSRRRGVSQFFVWGGFMATQEVAGEVLHAVDREKRAVFGAEPPELKANWFRIQRERERRYLKPYGITAEALHGLAVKVYELLARSDIEFRAAIVDKVAMKRQYGDKAWYPCTIAFEILCQRLQVDLMGTRHHDGGVVDIVFDAHDGKTPAGRVWQDNMKAHFDLMRGAGSSLQRHLGPFDRLRSIRGAESHSDTRLQVADLFAFAAYHQWTKFGGAWREDTDIYWALKYLLPRVKSDGYGRPFGHGLAVMPKSSTRVEKG